MSKIGRNDPCPCRSGRKYKHCCANSDVSFVLQEHKGHQGAMARAVDWLMNNHAKAVNAAIEHATCDGLTDEQRAALDAQDTTMRDAVRRNVTEWLIAEGRIPVKGKPTRVAECVLDRHGPVLTTDQRRWITQMSERPLHLYEISAVLADAQVTLGNALDSTAPPLDVRVGDGVVLDVGTLAGLRLMEEDGVWRLSSAAYPFSPAVGARVLETMSSARAQQGERSKDLRRVWSSIIRRHWLAQAAAQAD